MEAIVKGSQNQECGSLVSTCKCPLEGDFQNHLLTEYFHRCKGTCLPWKQYTGLVRIIHHGVHLFFMFPTSSFFLSNKHSFRNELISSLWLLEQIIKNMVDSNTAIYSILFLGEQESKASIAELKLKHH